MLSKSKVNIQNVINDTSEYVMDTYNRESISFIDGDGATLVDSAGKEYIDFVSGIAVNILGYKNKKLVSALKKASNSIWHTSNLYHIADQANLAKIIHKNALKGKTFFCNSGTEANEAALKLAFKYSSSISSEKTELVALTNSFHGRTLGSLSVTGQEKYRASFPSISNVTFVDLNDLEGIKNAINKNTAALIVELIQGEAGVHVMDEEFYKLCRKLTKKHQALFIVDEVQTGLYRTGLPFAFKHYVKGGSPDIITMAKGLGGGMAIGAMHASKAFSDILGKGDHASTFGGNALATAVALTVLKLITKKSFVEELNKKSELLKKKLESLNNVKEVRGMGLMLAIDTKKSAKDVVKSCLNDGLLLNATGDNTIRLIPPLVITESDIEKSISILSKHL